MDTPNSGFELIRKFPIDILAGIMFFVPVEDIGRLKMTGCKILWSILTCPNVIKSVNLGEGVVRIKSWPSFLNEFPSLESLRIENDDRQWWSDLSLTINQLPSTLRNLSLRIRSIDLDHDWSCDRFFKIPTNPDTIRLDEHLPHLEVLEILDGRAENLDWASSCPPTLTSLYFYRWNESVPLPSSIINFKSAEGVPTVLPLSLESLSYSREHFYNGSLPALTSLTVRLGTGSLTQEEIASLPQSLTDLAIYRMTLPSVTWPSLPTKLQSLSFCYGSNSTGLNRNPVRVETCPIELLPKSLTILRIYGEYGYNWVVPGNCPPLFPPHLKSFEATCLILAPNAAKQLPSSLTHLSTSHFYEELCEHLPQGLTSLSFKNAFLSRKTIQCLPKSLTVLSSRNCQEEWFDFTTGKTILSSSLPGFSVHKDYPSYFTCLPPNLISMELHGFGELQDDFIQNRNFSKLLSLTFMDMDQFSDNCIPYLNRHLTELFVYQSPKITGKCFKSLPRTLTSLTLGSSSCILDGDIQHLPRTLKDITFPCATEMTDVSISEFPRSCRAIDLRNNQKITQLCIPDLPPSMELLRAADWSWVLGDVKFGFD